MKIKELLNLSKEELIDKEKGLREELFKLNLQRYSGRVEKLHMFKIIRKDIARIQTFLKRGHFKEGIAKEEKQEK